VGQPRGTRLAPRFDMMTPTPKKPVAEPEHEKPEDVDIAGEAGPKETEFGNEKDAKDLTSGGFDPIP
jgi:hypothetical protein